MDNDITNTAKVWRNYIQLSWVKVEEPFNLPRWIPSALSPKYMVRESVKFWGSAFIKNTVKGWNTKLRSVRTNYQ